MYFKIKNWKLALLALLLFILFIQLGFWQLSRRHEKKILLKDYATRTAQPPRLTQMFNVQNNDWRFFRLQLEGSFDNKHSFLLDNKIFHGQVGYEVYTPFKAIGLSESVLVDRGFIPTGSRRDQLPALTQIEGQVRIIGMLNAPPTYVAWGPINESQQINWPLRIEFINLSEIARFLDQTVFTYILHLEPHDPAAYSIEWQAVTMSPQKHLAYAIQWFALALTLLILFIALNRA